ncbi:hypothetical protein [Roseibium sp. RKSG952]|uniref:hypothetical protein n=1 Tax=Roseibium sp. RKSG952 TaxID=2529384 RepID=UPI0012BD2BC1|nr:hypothetical protein [Roseibium sp. RKSG952]MTH99319.1 hypothetical protein [Roseibium sp. RKSG952]
MEDYRNYPPLESETDLDYARRLESSGGEEMWIRKALRAHRQMPLESMSDFFEDFPDARLRHLQLLTSLHPGRSNHSLIKKVSKNLGISEDCAKSWVKKFEETPQSKYDVASEKTND